MCILSSLLVLAWVYIVWEWLNFEKKARDREDN